MKKFINSNGIKTVKLPRPIPVYNADRTLNQGGSIEEIVEMRMVIGDHQERIQFVVTELKTAEVFIGHNWLKKHNPEVDWKKGSVWFSQ